MALISNIHRIDKLQEDFLALLDNIEKVLQEIKPKANLSNTKLWKIKKDLSETKGLSNEALAKLTEIVTKYNAINILFAEEIQFNKQDFVRIIEGSVDYAGDTNESYNDYFFELAMGARLCKALKKYGYSIKMDGICDVLVENSIAIECKYIHSSSGIPKNIQKAKRQIEARVANKQATSGFIALDLSNICPRAELSEFANYTFAKFVECYERLEGRGRMKSCIAKEILKDNNFGKIISQYILLHAETCLYQEIGFDYDLGPNVVAVIFQATSSFVFEHNNEAFPVAIRGMTYFLNDSVDRKYIADITRFIHNLATGI